MLIETPIYFSLTGKTENKELQAGHVAESNAELRERAIGLWYDIRQRQIDAGFKPTAAVWISQKRCHPTVEEIENHEQKVREILEREADHKESGCSEEPTQDVDDTGLEFVASVTPQESDVSPQGLALDDEDDLDF